MTSKPDPLTGGRGRPRRAQPSCPLSTRLPQPTFDQLVRLANKYRMPVSTMTRQLLMVCLRSDPPTV